MRVWTVDPERRDAFDALLEEVRRCEPRPFRAAVLLWNLDAPSIGELTPAGLQHAEVVGARTMLYLSQALAAAAGYETCRLWIVTRGAQRVVAAGPQTCDPGQALVWGFGRSIALEAPASWGGTIDLAIDSEFPAADAENIADVVLDSHGEQQVAVRAPKRYVPRLRRLTDKGRRQSATPIRRDATYLITGGTGRLGLVTAAWLVEDRGATHIALLSRRKPDAAAQQEVDRLQAAGARVRVYSGDMSIEADLRRVLAEITAELPGIRGVVHGAGVLADGILMHMSWDQFTRATAAKVHGTRLLHDCLRDVELDFFLVQSSLLSLTGSTAQANYTAANAFLDAFVDYRRYRGLPAAAINWGPWGGTSGMAAAAGRRAEEIWRARGITLISPALARRALDRVVVEPLEHVAVAICDWDQYVMHLGRSAPFYSRLTTRAGTGRTRRADTADGAGSTRVAERPASRAVLLDELREHVRRELGLDDVDTRQPLQELGVDSLMSVNLANRLEAALGLKIPIGMLVRGPCLEELADTLLGDSETRGVPDAGPNGNVRGETRGATESPTGNQATRAATNGARWLVFPRPNDAAIVRLFCFNYAGGGAAPFRAWVSQLAPSIELVVVEPPGRGSRMDEPPLVRLDRLLDGLMPEMRRFFGHCLGALTLFEAARRLLREGFPDVLHLFVSGARPPNLVSVSGGFEESLLGRLLTDDKYDPLRPLHEQPDDTFADALRQYNIWATEDLLAQRELRTLLLPAIRADFEMAATYKHTPEPPWDVPITCFNGLDDHYVTRQQAIEWNRYTRREFRIHFRTGDHFLVVDDRDFIVATINAQLAAALRSQRARS
jgi:surfactin synthase thioesterase subunit/NAD(P)-dependent dehydrogenase (short-subunit alcohol dehydrogenase family)/acyl carrier protein